MARKTWCGRCGTEHDPKGPCPMDTGTTRPRRSRKKGQDATPRRNPDRNTVPKIAAHKSNWGRVGRIKNQDGSYTTSWRCTVCSKTRVEIGGDPPAQEQHAAIY